MEEAPPHPPPPDAVARPAPAGDGLELPFWQGGISAGRDAIRLYDAVRAALRGAQPDDPSVRLVLDELRRQRRVMVATPLPGGAAPRCPAAIDILMPSPDGWGCAVRLMGELSWEHPGPHTAPAPPQAATHPHEPQPPDELGRWTLATVVKTQAHGELRHLSCIGPEGTTRRVAVRLGLLGPAPATAAQVCLRVRDATRLWLALGAQWSFRLLLGTQPLALALPVPDAEAAQDRARVEEDSP